MLKQHPMQAATAQLDAAAASASSVAQAAAAQWQEDFSMSKISSWRVGGCARMLFTPNDKESLNELLPHIAAGEEILFVGYGSNLLVRDGGFDGVVVRTSHALTNLSQTAPQQVYAEAGVGCPKLARFCAQHGLAGGEFWAGIPGTVGGALAMNAGCHGSETWEFVSQVEVFNGAEFATRSAGEFKTDYRFVERDKHTQFVGAWFDLQTGAPEQLQANIRQMLRQRSEAQPIGEPSTGSVFKNPPDDFAGRLIESCGLKGHRIGDAQISTKHANFIVNVGRATASDIEALIEAAQERVVAATDIQLQPEVQIVGARA